MKKNNTKLLVEEWRRVLSDGLYDTDPEVLEEGWKDALIGLMVATGLNIGGAAAKNVPINDIVDSIESVGGFVSKDSLYRGVTSKQFKDVYKKCFIDAYKIVRGNEDFKDTLDKMKNIPPLAGKITKEESAKLATNAFKESIDQHCTSIANKITKPLLKKIKDKKAENEEKGLDKDEVPHGGYDLGSKDSDDMGIRYTADSLSFTGVTEQFKDMFQAEVVKAAKNKSELTNKIIETTKGKFAELMKEHAPDVDQRTVGEMISGFFGL